MTITQIFQQFRMKGNNSQDPNYAMVYWLVEGAPDYTGAQSGFPIGQIVNIAIDGQPINQTSPVQFNTPTGPVAAGGDVSGTFPGPLAVTGIQGIPTVLTNPQNYQTLSYLNGELQNVNPQSATSTQSIPIFSNTLNVQPSLTSRNAIFVDGYASQYDGGQGYFNWDATSTATSNAGTVVAVTGVPTGRWVRPIDSFINVKWFGAVGDGIHDDAAAIQAAINFADLTSQTVFFPAGRYRCTTSISIGTAVLIGSGYSNSGNSWFNQTFWGACQASFPPGSLNCTGSVLFFDNQTSGLVYPGVCQTTFKDLAVIGSGIRNQTALTSSFTAPSVGNNVTISVTSTSGFSSGADLAIVGAGLYEVISITNSVQMVVQSANPGNYAPGTVVASGNNVFTSMHSTADFVQPSYGSNVSVTVNTTAGLTNGSIVYLGKQGGRYQVVSTSAPNTIVLKNKGLLSGSGASIIDVSDHQTIVMTGLSGVTSNMLGTVLNITGSSASNDGYFYVSAIFSSSSIGFASTGQYGSPSVESGLTYGIFDQKVLRPGATITANAGFTTNNIARGFSSTYTTANVVSSENVGVLNFYEGYNPGEMENFTNYNLDVRSCNTGISFDGACSSDGYGTGTTNNRWYNTQVQSSGTGIFYGVGSLSVFYGGLIQGNTVYGMHLGGADRCSWDGFWGEDNGPTIDAGPTVFIESLAFSMTANNFSNNRFGGDNISFLVSPHSTLGCNGWTFINNTANNSNFANGTNILGATTLINNGFSPLLLTSAAQQSLVSVGLVQPTDATVAATGRLLAGIQAPQLTLTGIPFQYGNLNSTFGNQPGTISAQGQYQEGTIYLTPTPSNLGTIGITNLRTGYSGIPSIDWRNQAVIVGYTLLPDVDNGHIYVCSTAGTCASNSPSFNTGAGSFTTDGTAVWQEAGPGAYWVPFGPIGGMGSIGLDGNFTGNLHWNANVANPILNQSNATSDVVPQNLTISPQAAYPSATSNKNCGNIILNLDGNVAGYTPAAVGVYFAQNGTNFLGIAPDGTNGFSLLAGGNGGGGNILIEGSGIFINASGEFLVQGTSHAFYNDSTAGGMTYTPSTTNAVLQFDNTITSSITINQANINPSTSTNGVNGVPFSITVQNGQSTSHTGSTGGNGGNLVLTAGLAGAATLSSLYGKGGLIKLNGGLNVTVQVISNTYTMDTAATSSDYQIFCNGGAYTITLPTAVDGRVVKFKDVAGNASSNNKTIAGAGGATIDGASTYVINTNFGNVTLTAISGNWYVT